MLLLQKIISNLFLSPMFLIIILGIIAFLLYKTNIRRTIISKLLLILICALYILSIEPTKDLIVSPLEKLYEPIGQEGLEEGDIYVILGSGIFDNAPLSLNESGIPTETALARIIEGVRLYKKSPKKIVVSGGIVFDGKKSEAEVYKKIMLDLGVLEDDIIIESKSHTTGENAKYTSEIMKNYDYEKVILITSATHMNRSKKSFERNGVEVIPAPCNYLVKYKRYGFRAFMPQIKNIEYINRALWEYVGFIYYTLRGI